MLSIISFCNPSMYRSSIYFLYSLFSGPVECDKPLDILSHKLGIFKVCSSGKEAKTRFQRMSYDGEYSIIKCKNIIEIKGTI